MCGFAGFLSNKPTGLSSLEAIATQMANAIENRGPDDASTWADAQAGIALGFVGSPSLTCGPPGISRWLLALGAHPLILTGEMLATSLSAGESDFLGTTGKTH